MSESQSAGGIHYDVSMDIKELLVGEKQVNKVMDNVEKSTDKATDSLNRLDKTAAQVSTAMKMPEINKLSRDMAQLSGKIGANSAATDKAMQAHTRFTGVLSTVSSQMGAGYVGNVGSATASLINHTKAAINATQAELANAEANKKQAEAYQASASQMVLNAKEEKKAAQEAVHAAQDRLKATESAIPALELQHGKLEEQRKIQKELLRDAQETYKIAPKPENFDATVTARNKMMSTERKIQSIRNQIDKEMTASSASLQKAKDAEVAASAKVAAATALEQKAKATLATTNEAVATATAKATVATQAQSIAMNGLRGVMALLGGPTGLLLLAAAGVYALYEAMTNDSAVKEYNAKIDEMLKKLNTLTSKQAEIVASELESRITKNNQDIGKLKDQITETKRILDLFKVNPTIDKQGAIESGEIKLRQLETSLNDAMKAQIRMSGELKQAQKATKENIAVDDERSAALEVFNSVAKGAVNTNKLLAKTIELGSPAAASMAIELSQLENQLLDSGISAKEAELQVSNLRNLLEANRSMDFELMLQGIEENVQALKIEMEEGKAAAIEYLATVQMAKAGLNDEGMLDRLISGMREQNKLQKQISDRGKKGNSGGSKKDKAAEEIKRQQNEVAVLKKRFELLSTGVADASRDMAMFEAVQKLGTKASNTQKEAVEKEAAEIYDLTQKVNDFIRAQEATPELKLAREFGEEAKVIRRMFDEGFIDKETFTRLGREATQAFEQGMTDIKVEASVNNIAENRAKLDPIQALQNENTRKLTMMKEYYDQEQQLLADSYAKQQITHEQFTVAKQATDMQYHMLLTAMDKQYQEQQTAAQWELMRNQSLSYEMMASAVDSFAGNASNVMTGLMTGTMSAADAMRSLGNTMLNSVVNSLVQVGVEMLKNFIIGQTMGTAAAGASAAQATLVATAWAPAAALSSLATLGANAVAANSAIVGTVGVAKGMAVAGARYNGGPVGAGQMYQVGEGGKPEIFKASTGKQYMIPGDNGRVISNKDMQGGGKGITLNIEFNDYSSGKHQFEAQASQNGDTLTVQAFLTDMQEKGPMHRSITQNTTATTRL